MMAQVEWDAWTMGAYGTAVVQQFRDIHLPDTPPSPLSTAYRKRTIQIS
jgi:hypothetical protein